MSKYYISTEQYPTGDHQKKCNTLNNVFTVVHISYLRYSEIEAYRFEIIKRENSSTTWRTMRRDVSDLLFLLHFRSMVDFAIVEKYAIQFVSVLFIFKQSFKMERINSMKLNGESGRTYLVGNSYYFTILLSFLNEQFLKKNEGTLIDRVNRHIKATFFIM